MKKSERIWKPHKSNIKPVANENLERQQTIGEKVSREGKISHLENQPLRKLMSSSSTFANTFPSTIVLSKN
jgi:hypothetical protein